MESGLLIGIDHGGTNTTALVLEPGRGKLSSESVPMSKHIPARGWVEHDPEDFLRTSVEAAARALVRAGLLPSAAESSSLAEGVPDDGGVTMVPSFTGLSAPHWEPRARACLFGLGLDTEPGHVARALLDGIAFQCAEIVYALNTRLGGTIGAVRADGGPSRNRYLMQRQADLLGMPVSVSLEPDMTALGAALLAGIGAGQLTRDDVADMAVPAMSYEPDLGFDERGALWMQWRRSVERVCEQARE